MTKVKKQEPITALELYAARCCELGVKHFEELHPLGVMPSKANYERLIDDFDNFGGPSGFAHVATAIQDLLKMYGVGFWTTRDNINEALAKLRKLRRAQ